VKEREKVREREDYTERERQRKRENQPRLQTVRDVCQRQRALCEFVTALLDAILSLPVCIHVGVCVGV